MAVIHRSDLALWVGFGIFAYLVFRQHKSPEIEEKGVESTAPARLPTEEDFAIFDLFQLTRHPNWRLATAATKILCRRAMNDPTTRTGLHQDAHSNSPALRERGEKGIDLIRSTFDSMAFNGHTDQHRCTYRGDADPAYLNGAHSLRAHGDREAYRREQQSPAHGHAQPESLIEYWDRHTSGARNDDADDEQNRANPVPANTSTTVPRPRNRNGSPGERARRRRRREAIVINTGDRPISQGDIIQRRQTG